MNTKTSFDLMVEYLIKPSIFLTKTQVQNIRLIQKNIKQIKEIRKIRF